MADLRSSAPPVPFMHASDVCGQDSHGPRGVVQDRAQLQACAPVEVEGQTYLYALRTPAASTVSRGTWVGLGSGLGSGSGLGLFVVRVRINPR